MNPTTTFLTGVVSVVVVFCLRRSLHRMLVDLCGTEPRADFWTAFSIVMLIILPLIFVMTTHPEARSPESAFLDIIVQVRLALIGLVMALLILGIFLCVFIFARPSTQ